MNKPIPALTRAVSIAALAFIFHVPSVAQLSGETEQELLAIQKKWADARVKPDISYLEHLYAKEFRVNTMDGAVATWAEDIAMFKEGRIKPEFVRDQDMSVSIYGDVALVTGVENVGGTYPAGPLKGQRAELSLRFANIFVHRDGRWQLVLHQGTPIPKTKSQSQ